MPLPSPDSDAAASRAGIHSGQLPVACLCTEWCGMCRSCRTAFTELAQRHPKCCFVWVDMEDHADALGDFDVKNFPIPLVQ